MGLIRQARRLKDVGPRMVRWFEEVELRQTVRGGKIDEDQATRGGSGGSRR